MLVDEQWIWLTTVGILAAVLYRFSTWRQAAQRQARFRLDQRRKAGIPDRDHRPFAEAAAAAARLRQEQQQRSIAAASQSQSAAARSQPLRHRPSHPQVQTKSPFASFARPRQSSAASSFTIQDLNEAPPPQWDPYRPVASSSSSRLPPGLAPASAPISRFEEGTATRRRFESPVAVLPSREQRAHLSPLPTRKRFQAAYGDDDYDEDDAGSTASKNGALQRKVRRVGDLDERRQSFRKSAKRGPSSTLESEGREKKSRHAAHEESKEGQDEEMEELVHAQSIKRKRRLSHEPGEESVQDSYSEESPFDDDDVREEPLRRGGRRGATKRGKLAHDRSYYDQVDEEEEEGLTASEEESYEDSSDLDMEGASPPRSTTQHHTSSAAKRKADTSDDHELGEEWEDLNGMMWKMGEDGIRRRLTVVFQMRPKYNMPKDSTHPDALLQVPDYVARYVSEEEYEKLKEQKLLSFQELEREEDRKRKEEEARKAAEEERLKGQSEQRDVKSPRRFRNTDLLFASTESGTPLRASAGPSTRGGLGSGVFHARNSFGRTSMSASPAPSGPRISLRASRASSPAVGASEARDDSYISTYGASPSIARRNVPLKRYSTSLDAEGKRRREEALMSRLRAETRKKQEAQAAANPPSASVSAAAPPPGIPTFSNQLSSKPSNDQSSASETKTTASTISFAPSAPKAPESASKSSSSNFFSTPGDISASSSGPSASASEAPKGFSVTSTAPSASTSSAPAKPAFEFSNSKQATKPLDFGFTSTSASKPTSDAPISSSAPLFGASNSSTAVTQPQNASSQSSQGAGFSFTKPTPASAAPSPNFGGPSTSSASATIPSSGTGTGGGGFSFGSKAPSSTSANANLKNPAISFGASSSLPSSSSSSLSAPGSTPGSAAPAPFSFGAPASKPANPPPAPFSFGAGATASKPATPAASTVPPISFNFGAGSAQNSGGPSSAPHGAGSAAAPAAGAGGFNFNFGATSNAAPQKAAPAASTGFSFGQPPAGQQAQGQGQGSTAPPAPFVFGAAGAANGSGGFSFGK